MRLHNCLFVVPLVGALACLAASGQTTIKKTPMPQTNAASGREMYIAYCASCHGKDATGNGPAATALKTPPPDLTKLAARNKGKFPTLRVGAILRGQEVLSTHGSKDMPVWGVLFESRPDYAGSHELNARLFHLTDYLKSVQQ
jgi:mono/diheme cytochrome c family protein